ncbi:hypothetical protein DPMN_060419 [Dreissena polymorpha]|uniref:Uncharacterized protein n=1 Tax=Dreissena polymorpha TaxID=45954 RepID=A0A9D4C573_DREPO|nr:hypothetical protein DPMN_060419 [Dreissena polymorpha]
MRWTVMLCPKNIGKWSRRPESRLRWSEKNARQTGGGHPMKAADTVTMSIIETMKDTPSFSGIHGASQGETTIGM